METAFLAWVMVLACSGPIAVIVLAVILKGDI
jgi:hypothetical protein